ncbi:uncharacterized protein LOC129004054 [Macrosteles quadrilineatus]|uniref:uncharacterized protein LOC129004054 n=1 Tax=Macrosteles quadrilineatus TaxID=74068 RepID=UPI0023E0A104|nr:uncharacterized protein LOC129004054 [Macrosteles quadrilineatus]
MIKYLTLSSSVSYKGPNLRQLCSSVFFLLTFLHSGTLDNITESSYDTSSSDDFHKIELNYALKPEEMYKKYEIYPSFDTTWDIITGPEFANVPFLKKIVRLWNTTRRPKIVQKKPRKRRQNTTTTIAPTMSGEDVNITVLSTTTVKYETTPRVLQPGQRHPFVLIEGTLTTARRRLLRGVMKHTTFVYVRNFRQHPFKYRDKFSSYSLLKLKRAYVTLQFYLTGRDVERILQERPVIMTGFWMRQMAEFLARRYKTIKSLPPSGDKVYQWPSDLVRPDLVFFLHSPRTGTHIKEDTVARLERIIEIYHRMNPQVIDVDQSYNNATEKQYSQLRKTMIDKLTPTYPWAHEYIKCKLPSDKLRRKGFGKNKTRAGTEGDQFNVTDETTASAD